MKINFSSAKANWSALLALVLILGGSVGQAQVGITLAVNGYYGSNLTASGAQLADGTSVKLGFFYSGSAFIPSATVLSNWQGLSGTLSSRLS